MCGLFGVIDDRERGGSAVNLAQVFDTLAHRGPDDQGFARFTWLNKEIALGHTRLSIIDLTHSGHQPMSSKCGRWTIVFNGEIYNYKEVRQTLRLRGHEFQSESDTEVLLAAWIEFGPAGLRDLVGMFAFAVYDAYQKTVTLVRDGFGIKPLYWSSTDDRVLFASEIPAVIELMGKRATPDRDVFTEYLLTGIYDRGTKTFFENVNRLRPGHLIEFDLSAKQIGYSTERWWNPRVDESESINIQDAAEWVRELFLESVRIHLRSDVPIGFALSGGIDSTAVVSAARYLEPDLEINTFSFISPGSNIDEEAWIDRANLHVNARPHKVSLKSGNLVNDIDDMVRSQGEPFGDTSIYAQYAVYRKAKEAGVTVTLDGQGADELFAGYHGYVDRRILSLLDKHQYVEAVKLLVRWSRWPGRNISSALRSVVVSKLPRKLLSLYRSATNHNARHAGFGWLNHDELTWSQHTDEEEKDGKNRHLASVLRRELTAGGLEGLMRHGDRNSMRWSIESRVPFLTIPIAEAALGLPEEYLLSQNGESKHVLRRAMSGVVPEAILNRRDKIGFQTPEGDWLADRFKSFQGDWLEGLATLPFVNEGQVRSGVLEGLSKDSFGPEIWRYLNASRWAIQFL